MSFRIFVLRVILFVPPTVGLGVLLQLAIGQDNAGDLVKYSVGLALTVAAMLAILGLRERKPK